jgi:hypothetical protein
MADLKLGKKPPKHVKAGAAMEPPAAQTFKLGKQTPVHDPRTLRFGSYLTKTLPPPPATKDWSGNITSWGMMGNDAYGDCTAAAAGHMIMDWTLEAEHAMFTVPDAAILTFYNHFAHGVADAGANMLSVLKYWRKHGLDSHKITAFTALQPQSQTEAMDAINLLDGLYIGVALPNSVVPSTGNWLAIPWQVPPGGPVGNAAPNPNNGHCIPAVGYDQRNLYIVTWGVLKPMSWEFYNAYCDESYAVLSPDFVTKTRPTPDGFDLKTLLADLAAITTVAK